MLETTAIYTKENTGWFRQNPVVSRALYCIWTNNSLSVYQSEDARFSIFVEEEFNVKNEGNFVTTRQTNRQTLILLFLM